MTESRPASLPAGHECQKCHRIGPRGFVPMGDYGWVCVNEYACFKREFRRRWGTADRYSGLRGHNNARQRS